MAVNQPQLSTRILSSFSITMRILLPTWSKKLPIFLPTFITVSLPFQSLWPHTLKTTPELTHFCGIEWMWSVDSLQERNIKYPTSVYLPMRWVWVRGLGFFIPGWPPRPHHMEDIEAHVEVVIWRQTDTRKRCQMHKKSWHFIFHKLMSRSKVKWLHTPH